MNIPKYVQDIMSRSEVYVTRSGERAPYGFWVHKSTYYTKIETLKTEINRMAKWAARNGSTAELVACDFRTRYSDQRALVFCNDPVMEYLRPWMPSEWRPTK